MKIKILELYFLNNKITGNNIKIKADNGGLKSENASKSLSNLFTLY